jgi:hemerythrin-like domain-containing protein
MEVLRMKYASEDLKSEHEAILLGLQILVAQVQLIDNQQQIELDDARELVNFFQLFADRCHHGKEEGFYFPNIVKVAEPGQDLLIKLLLDEHAAGRKLVTQMRQAVTGPFMLESYSNAAAAYEQLLREHIDQENNVLFAIGDHAIPPDEQSQILDSFTSYENEVMGPGIHEKLYELLDQLEAKYLVPTDRSD